MRQPYLALSDKLKPADDEARAQLASIPHGEPVDVVIIRERPQKFENLVYLTFRLVGVAMELSSRDARGWLAIKTGRCDVVSWPPDNPAPRKTWIPHGTGPSDMGRAQLEAFWDEAREVIRRDVLPHVAPPLAEQIRYRIEEIELAAASPR